MLSGFKIKKMTNCLEKKLGIDLRSGKHPTGWYYLDGKKILRVTNVKSHGGENISVGVAQRIKNSLKVSTEELNMIYECPMSGKEYEEKIRSMGFI